METPERHCLFFIVNSEPHCSGVSIVEFEQVNARWVQRTCLGFNLH